MFISFDSPLLDKYTFDAGRQTEIETHIVSAGKAIENYTHRFLEKDSYDRIFYNRTKGLFLNAYPVEKIERLLIQQYIPIHIKGAGQIATYSVGNNQLNLILYSGGTRTDTQIDLAYGSPTLGDVVDQINMASGWTADVSNKFADYPATDLSDQQGNAKTTSGLRMWIDAGSYYRVDYLRGIIDFRIDLMNAWAADSYFINDEIRVIWTGGYDPIPADLQLIVSEMVGILSINPVANEAAGNIVSESLGEYSVSYSAVAWVELFRSLSVNSTNIINLYRDYLI